MNNHFNIYSHDIWTFAGCIDNRDCHTNTKFCNADHVCEDKLCPPPVEALASAQLKFNHLVHKVGTTAQMVCLDGSIYHLGKSDYEDGVPVKQVNLHCTVGPDGNTRYVDDFGNTPLPGCSKGKFHSLLFDNCC